MRLHTVLSLVVSLAWQVHAQPDSQTSWDYSAILSAVRDDGIRFAVQLDLCCQIYLDTPGAYTSGTMPSSPLKVGSGRPYLADDHSMTSSIGCRQNAVTAHVISPASSPSTNFAMYLVKLGTDSATAPAPEGIERFVFLLDGAVNVTGRGPAAGQELHASDFIYHPAGDAQGLASDKGAGLLIYERKYVLKGKPTTQFGHTDDMKIMETPGEIFVLRKLLPPTADYDFNIHVMDFNPGEFLNVKEIHYNQHGLLLLQGQGIYRLGENWYPVQAGDAIWMGPYVPQWYCALGTQVSRYIIIKDTIVNPLFA